MPVNIVHEISHCKYYIVRWWWTCYTTM